MITGMRSKLCLPEKAAPAPLFLRSDVSVLPRRLQLPSRGPRFVAGTLGFWNFEEPL